MIVCKVCGNQNKDADSFCASCGKSLDLFGEHVADPPPPPPVATAAPKPEPAPELFIDRVKQAVHLDKPKPDPPPPTAFSVAPTELVEAPPKTPIRDATAESVAPADQADRLGPKTIQKPDRGIQPGDVVCWKCRTGNSGDRNFCRSCGANLKAAPIAPVKVPWYRRLFPARSAPAAGTRRSSAPVELKWGGAAFRVIAFGVIVLVVLSYLVISPLRSKVNDSVGSLYASAHKQFFPTNTPVRPSDATASSQIATHPARLAIDLITETYWAANTSTDKQPWLRLVFASPVDINTILITSGAGNDFATMARPKEVKIIFSDNSTMNLTLKDDTKPQSYDLGSLRHTVFVEIHILSIYPSAQSPDVAINEVEFFNVR